MAQPRGTQAPQLLGGFGLLAGFFPSGDANREVFDIGVAQLLRFLRGRGIGAAGWTATIGDNQGIFISWQGLGEFGLFGFEVDRCRDVTFFPRITSIDVDDHHFFVLNGFLEVGHADIREITGIDGNGGEECRNKGDEFGFHRMIEVGLV